jgi:ATP-dependent helicase/nuclease subunit B
MNFATIPATESFADILAEKVEDIAQNHDIPLSKIKIYLPTRRGVRTLQDAFLNLSKGRPRLLPIMQSIGDAELEEAEFLLSDGHAIDIPPAISTKERQFILARLLKKAWPHDYNYVQALNIAGDLGNLIDQIHTENINTDKLPELVQAKELAQYWELTTNFLNLILNQIWPDYLQERKLIDPGLHRRLRIEKLTTFYKNYPPQYPVIVAGSTGSIPVTREFIKTIGQQKNGYVVLPAFDKTMDNELWYGIDVGHPQYLLKQLVTYCNVDIDAIDIWSNTPKSRSRHILMTEMMRPASLTHKWQGLANIEDRTSILDAINGLTVCHAENDHHESIIIALAMAEIAHDPNQKKTATLITPDRYLAMRVSENLKLWGINIDDSGGTSLTNTSIGQFILAITETYKSGQIYPLALLTALKSPYAGGNGLFDNFRNSVRILENNVFRGVRPHGDFIDIAEHHEKYADQLNKLDQIFAPFKDFQHGDHRCIDILKAHLKVAETLASTVQETGAERLWKGEASEALAAFFAEFLSYAASMPDITLNDYNEILSSLLSRDSFTAKYGKHPRINILGQIEARMVKADRLILSGLNEGIWPPESGFDSWMSRTMRSDFGLPSLEQKMSLSAHDFATAFCNKEVFITRSKQSDGGPTLPSRWLQRLDTVLSAASIEKNENTALKIGMTYCQWAKETQISSEQKSLERPMPCPSLSLRPTEFSVTEIEKWMRDPYWIYAKKILKLRALDDIDMAVTMADRGALIHDIVDRFTKDNNKKDLPENSFDTLITLGEGIFNEKTQNPEIHGLWWPRFTKAAEWFIDHEKQWRQNTKIIHSEIKGQINFNILNTEFILKGKADRIEMRDNNALAIIDYKTGTAPVPKDVNEGIASQLPLEALIITQNGFENIDMFAYAEGKSIDLQYWLLSGGGQGGEVKIAQGKKDAKATDILIHEAYDGIISLFQTFYNDKMPYIASPDPTRTIPHQYNDYAHLQRISEWSVSGLSDGGDAT